MKISELRKNLAMLDGEERKNAEALLNSLSISFAAPKAKPRGAITTRLSPYYERINFVCKTCSSKYSKHFHFTERVMHGQHVLVANPISAKLFNVEDIPSKVRESNLTTCKSCVGKLSTWSKDELIAILLEMIKGGEFARKEKPNA